MTTRRTLLYSAAALGATRRLSAAPGEQVSLAFMGVNGRGRDLALAFTGVPGATVAVVCDVDSRAAERCAADVEKKGVRRPEIIADIRRVLERRDVDAVVIAAPDHWHAPATILACQAGKHVYCEKPACHNPQEGEWMVLAARKHKRVVQIGTQRRSMPAVREAIERLKSGVIGRVPFARGWYNNTRPTIGLGKASPVPPWLDFALWQGPAPDRPFKDNLIHYNWHWFWHWGTGELGNNGIHALDVCRWGLDVAYPSRVSAGGGKYRYTDDQESPDTHVVTYDFGDRSITWEGRSWHPRGFEGSQFGIAFYGEGGTMVIDGGSYRILDPKEKEIARVTGSAAQEPHLADFLASVRSGEHPAADVSEGVRSTLLCHLGNIAWRTERTLAIDPQTGWPKDADARGLCRRAYRSGWEPRV